MGLVLRFGRNGLELTAEQRDECRAFACAEVLHKHAEELSEAICKCEVKMLTMLRATLTGETNDR